MKTEPAGSSLTAATLTCHRIIHAGIRTVRCATICWNIKQKVHFRKTSFSTVFSKVVGVDNILVPTNVSTVN